MIDIYQIIEGKSVYRVPSGPPETQEASDIRGLFFWVRKMVRTKTDLLGGGRGMLGGCTDTFCVRFPDFFCPLPKSKES